MNIMRKNWKWLVVAAIALALVARFKLASVPVQGYDVTSGAVVAEVMGTGTLDARIKTTISPRIQEQLAEVLVDQGDMVKAGQLLARLDEGELQRMVDVSEADVASAKATAARVLVDETRAEAVQQQAGQDYKRISDLLASKVSSQAEMDKAVEKLRLAETDLERARAATLESRQQVNTAEKNLAYQRERFGFTRILSPYDGLITRRDHDPGGVLVPGSSLFQLISMNEMWISAWVDETAATGLAVGQPARVLFRSDPSKIYDGIVARLGRETDVETREFLVDVRLEKLPSNWTLGQRAEVFIETGRKSDALNLPEEFVQWHEGKSGVFVDEGGKARWHDVTLGLRGAGLVEVTHGLSAGDRVVAPADPKQPPLKPGQNIAAE